MSVTDLKQDLDKGKTDRNKKNTNKVQDTNNQVSLFNHEM